MRIVEVESFILHAELPRFVADSFNQALTWGLPGVLIRTDDGLVGTGYTSTLSHGDHAIKDIIDRTYAPLLTGENPLDTQRHWERLYWSETHWVGRSGITQMALAAVDIALWDLKAQASRQPLWRMLGGHKEGTVRSYNTDGGWLNFDIRHLIEEMTAITEQGWSGVKMKIGKPNPREDLKRVAAVREALGPDVDLMIDVNQRWDRTRALTWAERFAEFDITWLEEPLDPDDVDGHRLLGEATSIPIALGEHVYTTIAFRDFIEKAHIGYVQADVTRIGGITPWLAAANLAEAHHVPVVPHHADMMRVHQHLGAGLSSTPMIECIPWLQDLFVEPADIRAGTFHVSETPGASTAFDPEAFKHFRVA
jgi:L-alanine-DL-glutamate epimerase-like enolase superfamily enzyme